MFNYNITDISTVDWRIYCVMSEPQKMNVRLSQGAILQVYYKLIQHFPWLNDSDDVDKVFMSIKNYIDSGCFLTKMIQQNCELHPALPHIEVEMRTRMDIHEGIMEDKIGQLVDSSNNLHKQQMAQHTQTLMHMQEA